MRRTLVLLPLLLALLAAPSGVASAASAGPAGSAGDPVDDIAAAAQRFATSLPGIATGPLVAPGRETEPVVLTGAAFPVWAAPGDVTAKLPDLGGPACQGLDADCSHSTYEEPDASTQALLAAHGVPVDRLVAYRYGEDGYTQIPFQVDEVFTRYLSNDASGFSFYSMVDQHTTYAFDREGFRWTDAAADDPCRAAPASAVATDPVSGLDTLDELVFMARDAGPRASADAPLPPGIAEAYEVAVADPHRPDARGYVYIGLASEDGPRPAFDASNGYVRYARDADADVFLFSESSYDDYGNAPAGPWFDPTTGTCHTEEALWRQRRPGDQATVTTPRYRFRYDGRWLMTELQVSADEAGDWTYGADLVDRWKARAFQQRPGGQTPCCGYEEEENNWGGSSILMGELAGPVRVVRETWGADSGTNVVRRETFYRDEVRQQTFLRVHPIPPLDGIYAQWDHNAGAVETYYNPHVPDGVAIDGRNDEVFGNTFLHASSDGVLIDGDDAVSQLLRDVHDGTPLTIGDPTPGACDPCVSNDVDTADPLFSGPNALLAWEQVGGAHGTLVTRWSASDVTPGGAAHLPFALPYYRDDACFDDGTGANPGPHLNPRSTDDGEHAVWTDATGEQHQRECWDADRHAADPAYAADLGTARFRQGAIATHGMHLLLIADSDNAFMPLPLTEIDAEQRMVVLPPTTHNVGEVYGRGFEKPLVAVAVPVEAESERDPVGPPDHAPGPPEHPPGPPEHAPGPPEHPPGPPEPAPGPPDRAPRGGGLPAASRPLALPALAEPTALAGIPAVAELSALSVPSVQPPRALRLDVPHVPASGGHEPAGSSAAASAGSSAAAQARRAVPPASDPVSTGEGPAARAGRAPTPAAPVSQTRAPDPTRIEIAAAATPRRTRAVDAPMDGVLGRMALATAATAGSGLAGLMVLLLAGAAVGHVRAGHRHRPHGGRLVDAP